MNYLIKHLERNGASAEEVAAAQALRDADINLQYYIEAYDKQKAANEKLQARVAELQHKQFHQTSAYFVEYQDIKGGDDG